MMPGAVVIFGGSGFVGRNLVAALAGKARVVAISRTGTIVPGADQNIAMDRLSDIEPLPSDAVVINVAAKPYDASRFDAAQSDIVTANATIINAIYAFCVERGLKEIRSASSVAVYAGGLASLDDEEQIDLNKAPNANEAFYAWSKRWGEILAKLYADKFGIATISFRLSNPYGAHDSLQLKNAHVLPAFVIRALQPAPAFEILGNPLTERDFIYVADVCDIFERSLAWRGRTEAFNLCTGTGTTLQHLAQTILHILGDDRPIVSSAAIVQSVLARRSTNKKLMDAFGKTSFTSLEDGLSHTIRWYADALAQ